MIKVYMDTNMLEDYSNHNLIISEKILSDKFYSFLSQIKNSSMLYSSIKIIIPQVVVDEIKRHIKETYDFIDTEYGKIESVYKFTNLQLLTQNQKQTIDSFDNELKTLITNYSIVSIEKHKDTINAIYDRAVQKLSPFYKKNPGLDSGFKDAVVWKTVVDNTESGSKSIICSRDGDFCEDIKILKTYDDIIRYVTKNANLQDEFFVSYIQQDYIKHRMADEIGFLEAKNIDVEFLSHKKLENVYDKNDVVDCIKVKLTIDNETVIAKFFVDALTNEIQHVSSDDEIDDSFIYGENLQ